MKAYKDIPSQSILTHNYILGFAGNKGNGNKYINCAPAVAEFNEIKVNSISFMIEKDARIKEFDKAGNVNTKLNLTEIAVIGRA